MFTQPRRRILALSLPFVVALVSAVSAHAQTVATNFDELRLKVKAGDTIYVIEGSGEKRRARVLSCILIQSVAFAAEQPKGTVAVSASRDMSAPRQIPKLGEAIDREVRRLVLSPDSPNGLLVQQPGSRNRGWIGRHPALFGALVGAGAGAAASAMMENELICSGGDEDCLIYGGSRILVGAGMGAGIGSLIGFLVGLGR